MNADATIEREYLETRSLILRIGAALDRIERAGGNIEDDPRTQKLLAAIKILNDGQPDRATRIQLAFSRPYDSTWLAQRR